ncbi:MAG TPA: iron-containing redox enzyme family protein [Thermoleophilaceae bacterium]
MTDVLWDRIDARCSRWDVLRHPFYVRWSEGTLTREELARYAGQYRHAVEALAAATASAAGELPELGPHAVEEAEHVGLWDGFARELGAGQDAANEQTAACVEAWTAADGLLPTLARVYAIERAQPEVARVKREGLVGLYGVEDGPATDYFRVHETLDREHSAEVRALIDELRAEADDDALVDAAESAVRANWLLLDGVD